MTDFRDEVVQEDMEFVKENISAIQIKGQQHLLGGAKKLMVDYPTTIGKPIIENALKHGGKITINLIYLASEVNVKPHLTEAGTIIINC